MRNGDRESRTEMRNAPTNCDNIIDSRDVIKRIEELEEEREDLVSSLSDAIDDFRTAEENEDEVAKSTALSVRDSAEEVLCDWDNENEADLKALKSLAEEGENYSSEWSDGEALIRSEYFTEYAQQLCEDIGDIPSDLPGYIEVDWEATAENLKADYTTVDFDGTEYLIRSY